MKSTRGFTILEATIVIAVLGLIAVLVVPRFANVMPFARDSDAVSRAYTLNQAMFSYSKRVSSAATTWNAAGSDSARYTVLYSAGYLPGCPTTLALYQPNGYTFSLPASISTPRVSITGPNGTVTYN